MSFLPIVERELRASARQRATYRTRITFALVTSLLAAGLLFVNSATAASRTGTSFFPILGTLAFLYCLLAGIRQAADCLSEEKREGTLGFLFLTDLRGYDIVAGKLAATSIRTFQGLFAFFPILALGLVLGGMTPGEFWRLTLVLTCSLFFSLSIGLGVSALSRQSHRALAATVFLAGFLTAVPSAIHAIAERLWPNWVTLAASCLSPATAAMLAFDVAYQSHRHQFWWSLLVSHGLAWCFLFLASVVLPHNWHERTSPRLLARRISRVSQVDPRAQHRSQLRRRLLDQNPILWLVARKYSQRVLICFFAAAATGVGLLVIAMSRLLGGNTLGTGTVLPWVLALVLKIWVAWTACATLAEARRTGAVELLLATPLKVSDIITGHWQALQRIFLWPVVAVLALSALPTLSSFLSQANLRPGQFVFPVPPVFTLFKMATLVLDLLALAWVGMWMGMNESKAIHAFAKTFLLAAIVPEIVFCLPNIVFDLFLINWARQQLERNFRKAAEHRFIPASPAAELNPPSSSQVPPLIPLPPSSPAL